MTFGNRHRVDGGSGQRGYTLLEMLMVLAIFSLVIGFALPSLRAPSTTLSVKQAETALISALRQARVRAIASNSRAGVSLDLASNRLSPGLTFDPAGAELLGDAALHMEMTTARSLVAGEAAGAILFFPDGTSSGGRIVLQNGAAISIVEVDWMTGLARVNRDARGGRDG